MSATHFHSSNRPASSNHSLPEATSSLNPVPLRLAELPSSSIQDHAVSPLASLIGHSPAYRQTLNTVCEYAPYWFDIVLTGATGTGKSKVAKIIHELSPRAARPFIRVNCARETTELFDRHFFGSERGSYTGATALHKGYFEQAHGGTLFLDEIAELPLALQAKLLLVLDSHSFQRVGGSGEISTDVRLIYATNRHLEAMVEQNLFREDLLARMGTFEIRVPSLAERREDIPALFAFFFNQCYARFAPPRPYRIEPDVISFLEVQPWRRNCRQLRDAAYKLALRAQTTGVVTVQDAHAAVANQSATSSSGEPLSASSLQAATESVYHHPITAPAATAPAADNIITVPPYTVGTGFDDFIHRSLLHISAQLTQKREKNERIAHLLRIPLRSLYRRLDAARASTKSR